MYSLYNCLLAQHSRELTPLTCGPSTIAHLQRYFEDVVMENNPAALVVESLPATPQRSTRDIVRLKAIAKAAKSLFLMLDKSDGFSAPMAQVSDPTRKSVVWHR